MALPLLKACSEGNLSAVSDLLLTTNPADIEFRDESGSTPLVEAVKNGHVDVIRALLDKGADPSNGSPEQHTSDRAILDLLTQAKNNSLGDGSPQNQQVPNQGPTTPAPDHQNATSNQETPVDGPRSAPSPVPGAVMGSSNPMNQTGGMNIGMREMIGMNQPPANPGTAGGSGAGGNNAAPGTGSGGAPGGPGSTGPGGGISGGNTVRGAAAGIGSGMNFLGTNPVAGINGHVGTRTGGGMNGGVGTGTGGGMNGHVRPGIGGGMNGHIGARIGGGVNGHVGTGIGGGINGHVGAGSGMNSLGPSSSSTRNNGTGGMGGMQDLVFSHEFMQNVANTLVDDLDPEMVFRPEGDIDFERDFAQWFHPEDSLDLR